MNAVILAGGFGSRLKPLTDEIIKPMLPLCNTPMIDFSVSHLASFGIKKFVFTLAHKPQQILHHINSYCGIECKHTIEESPLGTLGGVKKAQELLDERFIVLSGDALEDIDFEAMLAKHISSKAQITMAVTKAENKHLYGATEVDAWGNVTGFIEKPPKESDFGNYVNCGVYIVEKSVLALVPENKFFDFSKNLLPALIAAGKVSAYIHDGYWCDIGDIQSYYSANFEVLSRSFFTPIKKLSSQKYTSFKTNPSSDNVSEISFSAKVFGTIDNCIIGRNAFISDTASLYKCIVCDGAEVKGRYANAIIGKDFVVQLPMGQENTQNLQDSAQISNLFLQNPL